MSAPGSTSRPGLRRSDVVPLVGPGVVVLGLNLVGWGVLLLLVVPAQHDLGGQGVFGVGLGVTAFLLGVRHAFDADHIAVIDNATRKLVGEGRPAHGVGFWFSLGHSSVVFGLALLLALGVRALAGPVQDEDSALQQVLGTVGALAAGFFLLLLGLANVGSLVGIARVLRRLRSSPMDAEGEAALERSLASRGLAARALGGLTRRVRRPAHIYPVGLLMGLGFDTATQVALLVLAAGSAAAVLPWYAVLVLPVLFAAGMTLFDTADGVLMARAYGWALVRPVRKVFYNLATTALSVVVAWGVGVVVLAGLAVDRLGVTGGPLAALGGLDLDAVGYAVVGTSLGLWLVAVAVWRLGRFEERWSAAR